MSNVRNLLLATAGAAGGAGLDVDDVYSNFHYLGNGSSNTITNNLDLSTEGGLVWIKKRSGNASHFLFGSDRDANNKALLTNNDGSYYGTSYSVTHSTTGFAISSTTSGDVNESNHEYCSWSFRKAPKFFDVVTYTGTSSAKTVNHNLGSVPGMIIIKCTSGTGNWRVYHRGLDGGNAPEDYVISLNLTNAQNDSSSYWNDTAPTSTQFTVGGDDDVNDFGDTYVAYLFAHNDGDGGFGAASDQDIIKCGAYVGGGSSDVSVNLGFKPQWLLFKSYTTSEDWFIVDSSRRWNGYGQADHLKPRLISSEGEFDGGSAGVRLTATGFTMTGNSNDNNGETDGYIYVAIRHGPLAEPSSSSGFFAAQVRSGNSGDPLIAPSSPSFKSDFITIRKRDAGEDTQAHIRSIGNQYHRTNSSIGASNAESSFGLKWQAEGFKINTNNAAYNGNGTNNYIDLFWRQAPSYFDIIGYKGTGSNRTVSHSLGVAPDMIWFKQEDGNGEWEVYHSGVGATKALRLNSSGDPSTNSGYFNNTAPTASVFTVGTLSDVNGNGNKFTALLFGTLAGVTKVGSYTGNGNDSQTIDCGFTNSSKFVLIKNTAPGGDWVYIDTTRGLVAGDDARILFNDYDVETSGNDVIDPANSGFATASGASNLFNNNGDLYVFYAIAA